MIYSMLVTLTDSIWAARDSPSGQVLFLCVWMSENLHASAVLANVWSTKSLLVPLTAAPVQITVPVFY